MIPYSYPQEKRNSDVSNLLRFLVFEKAGWYVALLGEWIGITPNGMSFLSCIPALVAIVFKYAIPLYDGSFIDGSVLFAR